MFFTRRFLYRGIEQWAPRLQGHVLDLGCGTKPYRPLFTHAERYTGVDIEISGNTDQKESVDVFYNGSELPFEPESVDAVFSSETFEHIFNLEIIVGEINRVLKKDGLLLVTCPFTWPEHEVPYDFARYTSYGIQDMLKRNGFEIVELEKTGNYFLSVLQLQALYLYYFINRIPVLSPLFFLLFISPIFLFGSLVNAVLPSFMKRKDLYLNNIILAKKNS